MREDVRAELGALRGERAIGGFEYFPRAGERDESGRAAHLPPRFGEDVAESVLARERDGLREMLHESAVGEHALALRQADQYLRAEPWPRSVVEVEHGESASQGRRGVRMREDVRRRKSR